MDEEEKKLAEMGDQNGASNEEALEAIKAQLEEEQDASVTLKEAMAGKDAHIAELEGQLSGLTEQLEGKVRDMEEAAAKLANVSGSLDTAVAKYLGVAKALNPSVPGDIIGGVTIEEIDASVEKGSGIVAAVRKTIEAEAAAGKVPAGAPERGGIGTEGLSPREKIAAGIKPK